MDSAVEELISDPFQYLDDHTLVRVFMGPDEQFQLVMECANTWIEIDREIFARGFFKNLFSRIDFAAAYDKSMSLGAKISVTINHMADDEEFRGVAELIGLSIIAQLRVLELLKNKAEGKKVAYKLYAETLKVYDQHKTVMAQLSRSAE